MKRKIKPRDISKLKKITSNLSDTCKVCKGTGVKASKPCPTCEGTGKTRPKPLK